MTNIQAINLLKGLWQSLDDYCELNGEGKAAFCMAIEALSCSEIPNSSDTISREAAVDALDKRFDSIPMEQTTDILLLRKDLRELPSVQPEKRTEEHTETHACDLIDRQAAIDIAKDLTITVEGYEMHNQAVMNYCADIKQLPSIQPKRGRWIHHPEIGWGETWLCDQCGEKTTSTVMGKPRANFCPNCGADMREETT